MRPGAQDEGWDVDLSLTGAGKRAGFGFDLHGLGSLLSSPTGLLILLLIAVLVGSLFLAWRDPVTMKIGFRNFVRGRRRTMVLLLGLLVGTAIISSSLVVGDTVGTLVTHFAYISDGNVHEAIYAQGIQGYSPFPYSLYSDINRSLTGQPGVQGVSPLLLAAGAAAGMDRESGVPQTGMNLVGTDANASQALGPFTTTGGKSLPGPLAGKVLLNPTSAQELDAHTGDHLTLTGPNERSLNVTVLGIVQADGRGGFQDNGQGNVFVTIANAQFLLGTPGAINYVAVTNVGGASGGIAHTSEVWKEINGSLPGILDSFPAGMLPAGITAHDVLGADVSSAANTSSQLTTLFLVIGLFSIVSGSILVVGIFVLLSEERRGQMGVARAIGMTRRQLLKSYYFEGLAYSMGSALLGTFIGVGMAFLLVEVLVSTVAPGASSQAVFDSFTVLPSSLLTAYITGFLLTLATVIATVTYVSRLNIVRAIRSLPEPPLTRKSYRKIALFGAGVVLLGLLLVRLGLPDSVDISVVLVGSSFVILGAGLIATAFVRSRYALTAVGAAFLLFWGDLSLRNWLFGTDHPGSIFILFLEGIFLILGAILVYLFNADLVMRALSRILGRRPKRVPVVMVAFSYPAHKPFRTAMTLSIFAMVLFTIVVIASIGNGIAVNVNSQVTSQSGGYTMAGTTSTPIPDFMGDIQNNSTLSSEIETAVPFASALASISVGSPGGPSYFQSKIAAAPSRVPANEDFYTSNHYNFSATLDGMSAGEIWQKLETDPGVAVVSGDYGASGFSFGPQHSAVTPGDTLNISVLGVRNATASVQVIGVLAETVLSVILLNPTTMTSTLHSTQDSLFLITAKSSANPQQVIYDLKRAFYPYGLQLLDFQQVFSSGLQFLLAFLDLLEIFVALGLIVGIAAIGILSLRAIVERRSEIGMIRAMGFRRSQVLAAFLMEYSFLALLGIGIGVLLGLLLSYDISQVAGGFFTFAIPWENLALIVGLSYALTLVATGGPSYRASRFPPAEALRYSE